MEEDLKDIDLIDRYLSNELDEQQQQVFKDRYLNDPEFKKEVEAYQKIYEGVEKATRDSLKQRLEGYYNEYVDEELTIEQDTKVIPISKWRSTAWISGIAASVLLIVFGIWYFKPNDLGSKQQVAGAKNNPSATTQIKKNTPGLPVNKGDQYSLTGDKKANNVQVLRVYRAMPLAYTFKDGLLSIYNNPTLGLIRLRVFRAGDQYHLSYDGDVYRLEQSASKKILIKTGQSEDFETKSTEKVKVQIAPLQASGSPYDYPLVRLQKADERKYFFRKEKGKLVLELRGDFLPANCTVVDVKTAGTNTFYLLYQSSVYALDEKKIDPTLLRELPAMASEQARQFLKRDPVIVPVYVPK